MKRRALFPYSGSKARILKYLPPLPAGVDTVCEPFAGSLAFSAQYRPSRVICADSSPLVRSVLRYLHTADPVRLRWIEGLPRNRETIAELAYREGLTLDEQTLVRLFRSGAYKGQLGSRVLYPQHRVTLDHDTLAWFRDIRLDIETDFMYVSAPDDAFWFVDPPYLRTAPSYDRGCGGMDAARVTNFVRGKRGIITYGNTEDLPDFDWQVACVRKVPILRGGGTRDRTEYFAHLNGG